MFLKKRAEAISKGDEGASSTLKRDLHFEGLTRINDENIKVTVSLETKKHENLIKASTASMDTHTGLQDSRSH